LGEEHESKVEIQEAGPAYRVICTVHGRGFMRPVNDSAEMHANARLIAAAPALLDALREAEASLTDTMLSVKTLHGEPGWEDYANSAPEWQRALRARDRALTVLAAAIGDAGKEGREP
jgi:hypothetical protein